MPSDPPDSPLPAAAGEHQGDEPTRHRLSKRLSPQAKKAVLTSPPEALVLVMAEIGSVTQLAAVRRELARLAAVERSWSAESRLLTLETRVGDLAALAAVAGVVHVDLAAAYRR
jgi:hypothetical protein